MVMGKIQDEFQVSSWALDEGTDMKNAGEDQDAAEMCHIAWRRKCWMVQLETNPAATKLLFVLFKPVHFCALVSSSNPGDVSHSNYLFWPPAKLRMRFS